jgi:hypothetical protein
VWGSSLVFVGRSMVEPVKRNWGLESPQHRQAGELLCRNHAWRGEAVSVVGIIPPLTLTLSPRRGEGTRNGRLKKSGNDRDVSIFPTAQLESLPYVEWRR